MYITWKKEEERGIISKRRTENRTKPARRPSIIPQEKRHLNSTNPKDGHINPLRIQLPKTEDNSLIIITQRNWSFPTHGHKRTHRYTHTRTNEQNTYLLHVIVNTNNIRGDSILCKALHIHQSRKPIVLVQLQRSSSSSSSSSSSRQGSIPVLSLFFLLLLLLYLILLIFHQLPGSSNSSTSARRWWWWWWWWWCPVHSKSSTGRPPAHIREPWWWRSFTASRNSLVLRRRR